MEKIFNTTAIKNDEGYKHFGISKELASMYGAIPGDIVELKLKLSEDQNLPKDLKGDGKFDYWGFYRIKEERFIFIYPSYLSLNMCFPAGVKAAEDSGEGKAYRLEVIT